MRKKVLLSCLVLASMAAVIFIALPRIPISLGNFSEEDITEVNIVNGNNGEVTEIPSEKIHDIYNLTKSLNRLFGGEVDTTGWDYEIIFITKTGEYSVEVISDDTIVIDGKLLSMDVDLGRQLRNAISDY